MLDYLDLLQLVVLTFAQLVKIRVGSLLRMGKHSTLVDLHIGRWLCNRFCLVIYDSRLALYEAVVIRPLLRLLCWFFEWIYCGILTPHQSVRYLQHTHLDWIHFNFIIGHCWHTSWLLLLLDLFLDLILGYWDWNCTEIVRICLRYSLASLIDNRSSQRRPLLILLGGGAEGEGGN